ncbi:ROK family transcriptional regulator [Microbacterium sp. EYE_5]|uniref:ROK family transcriptional regulator n=1 Tax=unclassified Microbacterium TaxID=2609290 RepID=UPI002004B632|nr:MULTISPECIES: ROK family transcriptional regulator [unclassified Microbacterium]MCK6080273.1 ROK family transcriptional regulator [Microbacterium sp. EYE_382]MCK6085544.1 ROK family transcriptional regulator [Microbacterium sp. EYE_384]MCK6122231.1 ROK family transcriptional regulator [Microbacterium sp. EYE_80]MCK6126307.1 ROK family transcriptional regulator [Microbacterium sp. EYE_79]MCK6141228.1 ROK family transcriptional regulator [Microbacterium sp. EYE_39]
MTDSPTVAPGVSELFQLLRDGAPRTRAELAKSTGLARSTIAARVDELMRMGLITAVADKVSTGGRPPSQFALNPGAKVVVAADLGASHATVAIADLAGTILAESSESIDIADGPDAVLTWLLDGARRLLAEVDRDDASVAAIGIGVPGPVEHSTGKPTNPPIMPGWDRFDVPGWLQRHIAVPVLVDNDVNTMALGERAIAWPGVDNLLFVKIATGIGAGLISDGHLQRGAQGVAGDIGHVQVARGNDVPCTCGNRGCLEALASGPAIARSLRAIGVDAHTGGDVVDLVKRGNVEAIQAVRQAGRDIGEVLTTCVSLVNPSVIAIGGSMARVGEHLIAGVREVVYARSTPLATAHLSIVQSATGAQAGVLGASMLAVEHALSRDVLASGLAAV